MDLRRVTAAAGAVGINALVAFAMVALSGNGPPSRPVRVEPVIARLVESPPPEPPKPVAAPPRPAAEPVLERRAERPAARAADSRPAPQAKSESAAAPVRDASAGDARPTPAATPAAPAAAPAATPVTPAPSAPAQSTPAATAAASAASASSVASAAPAPEAARRVGPRVDASWAGNAPPPYPAAARRMGEQGEVRLDVHVGVDGSVIDVQVRASSGSPALDRSAMDAVRRWRFRPATVDGQAVSEWYRDWKWVFRLEG